MKVTFLHTMELYFPIFNWENVKLTFYLRLFTYVFLRLRNK